MQIIALPFENQNLINQTAALLVEGFKEHWPEAWPNMEEALEEVHDFFSDDQIILIAIDSSDTVLGCIGGTSQYDGNVWELHPLVVSPKYQRQGIGKTLVTTLEDTVKKLGGLTLWVGTDDEDNMTSLAGVDLYPNVWEHLNKIRNLRQHPYEFYQKLGFVIVGVMPDANGLGKPDIFMAKRIV